MNVSFIGCPCSGKTTTAAMVFANLKETGLPVEFVPEQARLYIAQQRFVKGLRPEAPLKLSNFDQQMIFDEQSNWEVMMAKVCGPKVIVVSDTWSLASLLYMTDDFIEESNLSQLVKEKVLPVTNLVFHLAPVEPPDALDPNRIHDAEASKEIDRRIPLILRRHAPNLEVNEVDGTPIDRARIVLNVIRSRYREILDG